MNIREMQDKGLNINALRQIRSESRELARKFAFTMVNGVGDDCALHLAEFLRDNPRIASIVENGVGLKAAKAALGNPRTTEDSEIVKEALYMEIAAIRTALQDQVHTINNMGDLIVYGEW